MREDAICSKSQTGLGRAGSKRINREENIFKQPLITFSSLAAFPPLTQLSRKFKTTTYTMTPLSRL